MRRAVFAARRACAVVVDPPRGLPAWAPIVFVRDLRAWWDGGRLVISEDWRGW